MGPPLRALPFLVVVACGAVSPPPPEPPPPAVSGFVVDGHTICVGDREHAPIAVRELHDQLLALRGAPSFPPASLDGDAGGAPTMQALVAYTERLRALEDVANPLAETPDRICAALSVAIAYGDYYGRLVELRLSSDPALADAFAGYASGAAGRARDAYGFCRAHAAELPPELAEWASLCAERERAMDARAAGP